jgi:hypothetical protein
LAFHSGRAADHSPPSSSTEVKEWVELYLHSPICVHGVVLRGSIGATLPLPLWGIVTVNFSPGEAFPYHYEAVT